MQRVITRAKKAPSNFLFGEFNLAESYISLLLGIIVVFVSATIFMSLFRSHRTEAVQSQPEQLKTEKIAQELSKVKTTITKPATVDKFTYIVVAGDTLWSIADKKYKSGFEWVKIAKANNIQNPGTIEIGTKLTLPKVEVTTTNLTKAILATSTVDQSKITTTKTDAISGDTYTIKHGDDLWDIAVRAYGDGYKWPELAKANNLTNPDLIHADNVLKIPR